MTPPKDRLFLADVGYGFYVATIWNEVNQGYVYAMQGVDYCEGKLNDTYFENEYANESDIKSWIEMPKVEK